MRPPWSAARAAAVPVLGELELAWRLIGNEFIAVTGTNGKTTTTEWIGHIHREAGAPVAVAGNVGTALSSLVGSVAPDATIVCEARRSSSRTRVAFAPEAAVLLNLSPDHLDRHGSYDAYVVREAARSFVNQGNDDVAIAPDDLEVEDLGGCARRVLFGLSAAAEVSERAGELWWAERAAARRRRARAARRAQPRQRAGGRGRVPDPRARPRGGRDGPANVQRASRTGSSWSRASTASRTSTTRRRRTSRARSSRCARTRAACT